MNCKTTGLSGQFSGWENYGKENDCRLYLGGGAGFHSKTLLQAIYQGNAVKYTSTILQKIFRKHQHCRDCKIRAIPSHVENHKI